MKQWLLISNCQTTGLANSMNLLTNEVNVTPLDIWLYNNEREARDAAMGEYERVVIIPEVKTFPGVDLSRANAVSELPFLHFSAYHPDLVYVLKGGTVFKGPLEDYHSLITFAAFMHGLSVDRTLALFTAKFYERCGYMDHWLPQRDAAIAHFGSFGLDIAREIRRWGRGEAFMYSVNHPRIRILRDLARIFLEAQGVRTHGAESLPHDNLAFGQVFPVYPEIGERLGVPGSYRFKRAMSYEQLDLRRFVAESFAAYDGHEPGLFSVPAHNQPLLDHVLSLLRER